MDNVFQTYIRTTPQSLWDAITNPDVSENWFFGGRYESDWKPGSGLVLRNAASGRVMLDNTVIEVDRPRKIVHTFKAGGSPHEASTVTWEITPMGEVCLLDVVHHYRDAAHPGADGTRKNWAIALSSLKTFLETGKPLGVPMAGAPAPA